VSPGLSKAGKENTTVLLLTRSVGKEGVVKQECSPCPVFIACNQEGGGSGNQGSSMGYIRVSGILGSDHMEGSPNTVPGIGHVFTVGPIFIDHFQYNRSGIIPANVRLILSG